MEYHNTIRINNVIITIIDSNTTTKHQLFLLVQPLSIIQIYFGVMNYLFFMLGATYLGKRG